MTARGDGQAARAAGNGQATFAAAMKAAWSYIGAVMGDHDYRRYVAHHSARHPDTPPLSERAYWRMRHDEQEANPQGRCC
ncbi:YbdD/YjiX family protein [Williamsia sp. MIQD14]|uniref:YbdD/YjiX family protein n=1 Tax=Williamsia sp. MIQD14 TaxID=3425703 RepID=UPI003DA16768